MPARPEEAAATLPPAASRAAPEAADEATVSLENLPGFDVRAGLARVGGNEKLYRKLLTKFHASNVNAMADIRAALEAGDRETATRLAHTVKGVAGNLGAVQLAPAAGALEAALKHGDTEKAWPALETVGLQLESALVAVAALGLGAQPSGPTGAPAEGEAVDTVAAKALLEEIAGLLESDLMEAMGRLEGLRDLLDGISAVRSELDALVRDIEGFDTDAARGSLERLAGKVNQLPAGNRPANTPDAGPLLREMAGLLESDLMEAMNKLETLRDLLEGVPRVSLELEALVKDIDGFDTDAAAKSLRKLAEKLKVDLG